MGKRLVVCGAAGRMGRRVIALSLEDGFFRVIGAVERQNHPDIGKDIGSLAGKANIGIALSSNWPAGADVVIDFSQPDAVSKTVEYCIGEGCALVVGTTGLNDSHADMLRLAARTVPVICATNMSVGMNLLFSVAPKIASLLGDSCDIEIVEQHHQSKKDAPSGSALTLAKNICEATGRKWPACVVHGRSGVDSSRKQGSIGVHSVRAGDIVGIHSVIFGLPGEKIELVHTAHSRDCFARGALAAAKWLLGRKAELYSMADVLGIR